MKKILITGSKGFLGKNLVIRLKESNFYHVLEYDKENSLEDLQNFILEADIIIHLAGTNRPKILSEYQTINVGLTEILTQVLTKNKLKTPIIFSSSTQAELSNPYGVSKRNAEQVLQEYAQINGNSISILRLTNVFGKWCRPNYNSVVATFCYNTANDMELQINDGERLLKLVYIDDVVSKLVKLINDNNSGCNFWEVEPYYEIKLNRIAEIILSFKYSRENLILPDVSDQFIKKLYSTYLSYLPKSDFSYDLKTNTDNRGKLTELIKSENFGQIFISSTIPGITRGNHYHHTKTEKFIVIKGKALISFRKIDEEDIITYEVSGDKIEVVDIPPGYTHNIVNVGDDELITLFWANEIFNPENPDTWFLEV